MPTHTNPRLDRREMLTALGGTAAGSMFAGTASGRAVSQGASMTIASAYEPGHILVQIANDVKDAVEDETGGDFSVDVSAGGAYGAEDEISEIVQSGGVEAQTVAGVAWNQFAPDYFFYNNPYVMEDFEHVQAVFESEMFEPAFQQMEENGNQYALGQQTYIGRRHVTSNTPIRSPEDLEGIDLRLPELDTIVSIWNAIGASPTPVALDELYSALDTGIVDGSEGPPEQVYSFNLQEVQSHYSLTEHQVETGSFLVNRGFYDRIDESYQTLLDEVAQEVTEAATEAATDREDELIGQLSEEGMTVVDDVDVEAFREAAEPAISTQFEESWAVSREEVQDLA